MTQKIRYLRPDVAEVIAIDVDPAVMQNRSASRCATMVGDHVPLADSSVDLVVSDFVCEHVENPTAFIGEVGRVLRPGGMFCARTPHTANYVSVAARMVPNPRHVSALSKIQPDRLGTDVFPTFYRLNSLRAVAAAAPDWRSQSFIYRVEPGYFFGSRLGHALMTAAHHILPTAIVGNLFIFLQKPVR